MAVDVGTGSAITFSAGFVGQIINITYSGISRPSVEISHMATTDWHKYMPGDLVDPGQLEVEFLMDPNDTITTAILAAEETVTLTTPIPSGGLAGATRSADGFLIDCSYEIPLEDRMTGTAIIKLSEEMTQADST